MTTVDCPICDRPVEFELTSTELACDGCRVHVEIAPDPAAVIVAAAA